jgi:glycosyltransferase involved in cell wall biosynthesis
LAHFVLDARTATPHFPGIGRYVTNLARALAPLLAPDARLTLLHSPGYPVLPDAVPGVTQAPVAVSPFSITQQWHVPGLLRHFEADLYHSSYLMMPYWPGAPTVLTVYDLIPLLLPEHSSLRARTLFRWGMRLALRAADRVITISTATRRDFLAHFRYPSERVQTIPLAADPAFRPQPADVVVAARARYGLPERFVLYVGSNKPHKNLVTLVEAWGIATSRGGTGGSALVVTGTWDRRYEQPRLLARETGLDPRLVWLGPIPAPDLVPLYAAATAFVFPSLYEGFGLPVLEAMACATPVICSNTSSLPEVAGDAALLVDARDAAALADAIERVLADDDLCRRMRELGLAQAGRFSWERNAEQTLALYRRCVQGAVGREA